MARAALRWGVRDLARHANITYVTVTRVEFGKPAFARTLRAIRTAFEEAGLKFLDQDDEGPGVRFAKPIDDAEN
jgi:transcriptional regulator with XRE-family HTH domain